MKFELRIKVWFISSDFHIVQGVITKREMTEVDDHDDGKSCRKAYLLRTSWQGKKWVAEEDVYGSLEELVNERKIECNFE